MTTAETLKKYADVQNRLEKKIGYSQVPVPGFIVGLSGTDSLVAFDVLYKAMEVLGRADRMYGVHYAKRVTIPSECVRPGPHEIMPPPLQNVWGSRFARLAWPWLLDRYPKAYFQVAVPLGGNQDQQRWADLHLRALNEVDYKGNLKNQQENLDGSARVPIYDIHPRPHDKRYWIAGAMNATEDALGKYSILANSVSIQPVRSLWKSEILTISQDIGVPQGIIEDSRIPDCACGRDEIAAENIELLDGILRSTYDPTEHDPALVKKLLEYIQINKTDNGFRQRIPYRV